MAIISSAAAGVVPVDPAATTVARSAAIAPPLFAERPQKGHPTLPDVHVTQRRQPLWPGARARDRGSRRRSPNDGPVRRRPGRRERRGRRPPRSGRRPGTAPAHRRVPARRRRSNVRPSMSWCSLTSPASSNRRLEGLMAEGRREAMSPGSKGGSSSSRSPSARTCGSNRARPGAAARNASASARADRRVGRRMVASGRSSGRSASSRPLARSARNGRWPPIVNQRGAGASRKFMAPNQPA